MFQGFLNTMDSDLTPGQSCSNWAMCKAGREARLLGSVGAVVATVARHNTEKYLKKMKNVRWMDIEEEEDMDCDEMSLVRKDRCITGFQE